jgi:hypothetical protein
LVIFSSIKRYAHSLILKNFLRRIVKTLPLDICYTPLNITLEREKEREREGRGGRGGGDREREENNSLALGEGLGGQRA